MVKEALVVISTLSQLMSGKMDKPILHVTGWANRRIAIVVVSSYLRVLELSPMGTLGLPPSPGYKRDCKYQYDGRQTLQCTAKYLAKLPIPDNLAIKSVYIPMADTPLILSYNNLITL